jgi:predicted Mrr-cat superfamily restriction endonuclease
MSHWFLPRILSDDALQAALRDHELQLEAEGMPDLSRAQGADQIKDWLKQRYPEATPEHLEILTLHYWRLGHNIMQDDTIIVPVNGSKAYLIGEVTGVYRREVRTQGMCHVWPVEWRGSPVEAGSLPALAVYAEYPDLVEVTDEDALKSLAPYVPSLRQGNARIFRWIAIGTLISELIYFWPRR